MSKTRTARRFLAAASLTAVGFVGLADVAAAGPVQGGGGTIVAAPHTDPEPQPDPPTPEGDLPIADPEPEPQPPVDPDLPLGADLGCTFTHGCPEDDEVPTPDGHCFDDAGEVVDPSECIPTDDDETKDGSKPGTEVEGSSQDRGALPRTGAGLAALAGLGTALAAGGAAAKRLARR